MFLYQYLDALPKIPEELLVDPYIHDESLIGFQDGTYTRWAAEADLLKWLGDNISEDTSIAGVQLIENVLVHCDKRKWALNYIFDAGGDTVRTNFHWSQGKPLLQPGGSRIKGTQAIVPIASVIFQPGRWHLINTNVLHSVTGVTGLRKAVTIGLTQTNPFEVIKGYQGLLSNQ